MGFTTRAIDTAPAGAIIRDSKIRGLYARKNADGSATFHLYYRTASAERRFKLGPHPSITIAQARTLANGYLVQVAAGKDPARDRQEAREAPTVKDLADKYRKEYAPRKKSAKEDERMLDKIVVPKLGKLRAADVTYDDVAKLHASMKSTPTQANRVHALLSRMFSLAERWRMRPAGSNPARGVERYKERKRRRTMTTAEAAAIARRLEHYRAERPQAVAFIYALILSGARPAEMAGARWEWLDGQVLNLPDSKTGEKPVYLPPQLVALLEPFRKEKGPLFGIKSPKALWVKVRNEVGCSDLRLYDLRRTFASVALSLGLTLDQIAELYGHASTQTTTAYAWMLPQPAARAAETVATKLGEMMAGGG